MHGLQELDRVLRGDPTPVWLSPLLRINLLLAAFNGVCIGVFGLVRPEGPEWRQGCRPSWCYAAAMPN